MKKIMILGASLLQVPAILKAKELGFYVIAIDQNNEAIGFSYADLCLLVSTNDREEVYQQALINKPDVIITSASDAPVRTVSYVNQKLGRTLDISYEDSLYVTNKAFMRLRFKEYNIPIPEFYIVNTYNEYQVAIQNFTERFILKPVDSSGSRGVKLVKKDNDLAIKETYFYSKRFSKTGELLVEEFLEGTEVSVESFTINRVTEIIAITDKMLTPPPFFVEIGHAEQSLLDQDMKDRIQEVTLAAIKAVNIINGPSHTEIMLTKEGPKVIEIGARLGGDFITSHLVPLATGVNLVECSIMQAIGSHIDIKPKYNRGAAIRFLLAPFKRGIISGIMGIEEVRKIPGVHEVVIYKKIGDELSNLESSSDRIGHIIAYADTTQEAMNICDQAIKKLEIKVR